jgi:hypothetical protein
MLGHQPGVQPLQEPTRVDRVGGMPVDLERGSRMQGRLGDSRGRHTSGQPAARWLCQKSGPGKWASGGTAGLKTMWGSMPLAHCTLNSVSNSVWARCWSYQDRPIATNAESQLHWCGYRPREGTVEAPIQLSSSTALAAASSSVPRPG